MSLPRLLVVTDRTLAAGPLTEVVAAAVRAGARAVIVRDRDLPPASRAGLIASLHPILASAGGHLLVHHLPAGAPFPSPRPAVVGRSCHDSSDVDTALAEGCDYVTVSPVAETRSKPGYGPALGAAGLGALIRPGLPAYALGGVVPAAIRSYVEAGAYGVAVMGAIMRDPSVVPDYLKELPS